MFALQRICLYFARPREDILVSLFARQRGRKILWIAFARQRENILEVPRSRVTREKEFFISNTRVSAGGKLLGHFRASARRIFSFISMSRAGVLCLGRRCRPWPRAPHWVWGQATNFQRERADSVKNTAHYSNCVRKIRKIFGKRPLSGKCKIFMFLL